MNPESEENIKLQKSWCVGSSPAIQNGARDAVNKVAAKLTEFRVPIGDVLEIGPQNGYGMDEWRRHSDSVAGIEIVPEFISECLGLGLTCHNISAEDVDQVPGSWNFYIRDAAEHFVDRDLAFSKIIPMIDKWIYISVPIEPGEPKDEAHLSKFDSVKDAQDIFTGMTPIEEIIREPTAERVGRYSGVWIK